MVLLLGLAGHGAAAPTATAAPPFPKRGMRALEVGGEREREREQDTCGYTNLVGTGAAGAVHGWAVEAGRRRSVG